MPSIFDTASDSADATDSAGRVEAALRTGADSAPSTDSAAKKSSRHLTGSDTAHATDATSEQTTSYVSVPIGTGWESNGRVRTGSGVLSISSPIEPPPPIQTVTLAAPITSTAQTTIQTVDPVYADPNDPDALVYIQVATEVMLVTGGLGTTTLTVLRAQLGTTAITSAIAGTPVAISTPVKWINWGYETYNPPTLTDYQPQDDWQPVSQVRTAWGRLRLKVNGVDASHLRGTWVMIDEWSDSDNFGDDAMAFIIYSSTAFEPLGGGKIPWLTDNAKTELQRVHTDGTVSTLWEGDIGTIDDSFDGKVPLLTGHNVGILKTLDDRITKPRFDNAPTDTGVLIARFFNNEVNMGFRAAKMKPQKIGRNTTEVGEYGAPLGTTTIQDLLVSTVVADGGVSDGVSVYSMTNLRPRGAQLVIKDKNTHAISLQCGQRGVTHSLTRDPAQLLNAIFGHGTDANGNEWRNTKYPNAPTAPPIYPYDVTGGLVCDVNMFCPGDSLTGFQPFSDELRTRGYKDLASQDSYLADDEDVVSDFQDDAGILVDGIVGPQTWSAAFQTGTNAQTLFAYLQALAYLPQVDPYLYNSRGGVIGPNPRYNPSIVRREKLEQFGALSRAAAQAIARLELKQYGSLGFSGTVTLTNIDPPEMCALDIRAGMNLLYKGHRGANRLLHISSVKRKPGHDALGGSPDRVVTLTVDERFRDFMALAQMLKRERGIVSLSNRTARRHRNAGRLKDYAPFDAESGAGYLPRLAQTGGLWNFYQIPAGYSAQITHVRIVANVHTQMAACVFDRPMNEKKLLAITNDLLTNPTNTNHNGDDGWTAYASPLRQAGMRWGSGGANGMQGYWPNKFEVTIAGQRESTNLTGVLDDANSWDFTSKSNPWLWLGVWTQDSCVISGDPDNHLWSLFSGAVD